MWRRFSHWPVPLENSDASGGVSVLDDLTALHRYAGEGVGGAIVGKALYTKAFTLTEAVSWLRECE